MSSTTTDDTLPPGASWVEHDALQLYARTWESTIQPPKAVLVAVHGLGEHIDRYDVTFGRLAEAGIQVHGWDQRGFGRTGRRRGPLGHTHGWEKVMEDVEAAVVRSKIPGVPTFLYGHSMGGMIALNYGFRHLNDGTIKGIISSAPAIEVHPKVRPWAVTKKLGTLVSKILPSAPKKTKIDLADLSHDPKVQEAYAADIYNLKVASVGCLSDMLTKGPYLFSVASKFTLPLLLVHGQEDEITSTEATQRFFGLLPEDNKDKTLRMLEKCRHEPHNEPEHFDVVVGLYVNWILERAGTA